MIDDSYFINIDTELCDALKKEALLAYFGFTFTTVLKTQMSGLVKISKPRVDESESTYFSLFFIMDTPDEAHKAHAERFIKETKWNDLAKFVPGVETVLQVPFINIKSEYFLSEIALYVALPVMALRSFICDKLFNSIVKITGIKAGDIVFWED
ncbi:MAG: hypothetical protein H7844_12370 [Nitrospirae bacterium YQR-1]